jgi:hypothetical protein
VNIDNRWYSVLDDIDEYLDRQEAALAEGRTGTELDGAFPIPPGLGALPPNLAPRYDALREREGELKRRARYAQVRASEPARRGR